MGLDILHLFAEMPEGEVMPPPLPVECYLGHDTIIFALLRGGGFQDLFKDLCSSADPEHTHEY